MANAAKVVPDQTDTTGKRHSVEVTMQTAFGDSAATMTAYEARKFGELLLEAAKQARIKSGLKP